MDSLALDKIYRIQNSEKDKLYISTSAPMKRVEINKTGCIKFNPNSNKFIYFSRTEQHHAYYIFNKVFKIIKDEIRKANADPQFQRLNLSEDFRAFTYYSNVNIDVIKRVKEFFSNYIPPKYLELVTLKYLNTFTHLLEECTIRNVKKNKIGTQSPEISDTTCFGGGYGINSSWLELLNCCTVSTQTAHLPVERVFDFLLETSSKAKVSKQRLTNVFSSNSYLMDILQEVTYTELLNPQFFDQNNTNDVVKYLEAIDEFKLYNQTKQTNFGKVFTPQLKKQFKADIHTVESHPEFYL